ncbi:hypothetical protein HanPSC8_Chr14g0629631 [Helianthus annuus]|nr:hypothetical protein HanPSC8_Chr14g0629631 [Helianthus annuus]
MTQHHEDLLEHRSGVSGVLPEPRFSGKLRSRALDRSSCIVISKGE